MSEEKATNYWVITSTEAAMGPYEDYATAYIAATTNIGQDGWTITTT